jgi:hypothetical protein
VALVGAFLTMMPRLEAESQLAAVRAGGLAFGGYEKHDAARMLEALRNQAAGERAARPRSAGPTELATMGIGMVVVNDV